MPAVASSVAAPNVACCVPTVRADPTQVATAGSAIDTLLAVYTGAAVNALTRVVDNDDCPSGGLTSCVTFTTTPGTVYYMQVLRCLVLHTPFLRLSAVPTYR
jgi:hypothetical protein